MNELIKVTYENDRLTVSGRDLHKKLGISTRYNDWFSRVCEYGFTENEDYIAITQKRVTAQGNETTFTDHQLTIEMAKQICMIQRTEVGKQYREYFLTYDGDNVEYICPDCTADFFFYSLGKTLEALNCDPVDTEQDEEDRKERMKNAEIPL